MPWLTGRMASGVYRIPRIEYEYRCVVTNTTPVGAYRGAGRPEATALLERAMDSSRPGWTWTPPSCAAATSSRRGLPLRQPDRRAL